MKAFPLTFQWDYEYKDNNGMDLRDYFAAKAMNNLKHLSHPKDVATEAYRIADAMMKAREEK